MRKSLSLMLMALLVLTGSVLAQDGDMQATANEIADNLSPVQRLIRSLKISEAIDELQFIIGELQGLTTDKLFAILKKVVWPAGQENSQRFIRNQWLRLRSDEIKVVDLVRFFVKFGVESAVFVLQFLTAKLYYP